MLESLHLKNVGPAPEMRLDLAPRLNLITGDNGLGKTLLIDCVWWALTSTWPITWGGRGVVPEKQGAEVAWTERRDRSSILGRSEYAFDSSSWERHEEVQSGDEPDQRGLAIYLRVDGGVSVFDPLRADYGLSVQQLKWGLSRAFQFREPDIWDGLELDVDKTSRVCEGLVRDVVRWSVEPKNADFARLAQLIEDLSGEEHFRLTHKVGRVYVDDSRDFPFVLGPAGDLPAVHAPAGLRRILGLAYLLVWAFREHRIAAGLKRRSPSTSVVLLVDEVESHLHPKWQRTILPSLLRALGEEVQLQIIATTHSPMVLASVESLFDSAEDAWFDLDVVEHRIELRQRPYVRMGEVGNWLTSEAFDLAEPRSLEGERAIRAAQALLGASQSSLAQIESVDRQLREAGLPDIDPFWVRWGYFVEQARKAAKKP